jgi:hypothetical protein
LLVPAEVDRRLRDAGFEVSVSGAFGGYVIDGGLRALVARKK